MKNFLLIVLAIFCSSAYAGINKWVDENNQVHYSDNPPPSSAKTKKLLTKPDPDISNQANDEPESGHEEISGESKTIAEREMDLRKRRKEKQEAADKEAEEQANQKIKQANCDNARKNLKTLQSGIRMVDIDDNGERFFLDDTLRKERISKTQEDISRVCN